MDTNFLSSLRHFLPYSSRHEWVWNFFLRVSFSHQLLFLILSYPYEVERSSDDAVPICISQFVGVLAAALAVVAHTHERVQWDGDDDNGRGGAGYRFPPPPLRLLLLSLASLISASFILILPNRGGGKG